MNLVHEMINDIDQSIQKLDESITLHSTSHSSSNESHKLKTLKHEIIQQAILANRRKIEELKVHMKKNKINFVQTIAL